MNPKFFQSLDFCKSPNKMLLTFVSAGGNADAKYYVNANKGNIISILFFVQVLVNAVGYYSVIMKAIHVY